MQTMSDDAEPYDIFRHSWLRYLGYANELGEAFRPLVRVSIVRALYFVDTSYIIADAIDKTIKIRNTDKSDRVALITFSDAILWQMMASVVISGYTINRITWTTGRLLTYVKAYKRIINIVPTATGIASILIIAPPIDNLVNRIMNYTFRKWFKIN
ncbi:mitochondrial fission process protein 1-like [Teleopsis dalmanni]|uniref:mitochondrial fission process protein 1-like n=1 Tax=Teleopsis dalmanni TaxID=139649 RepID=UPI0018CF091E|nr:mitochondrial fission process protein 1-like [Teleopsis dalmanni]